MMKLRFANTRRGFALLTLTTAAASTLSGHAMLTKACAILRRRKIFRATFAGGELHTQIEPTASADDRAKWNCHFHGLVELFHPFDKAVVDQLREAWTVVLRTFNAVGSLDLKQRRNLRNPSLSDGMHPAAFYVTRRVRSEWISDAPAILAERVTNMAGRRCVLSFGLWRATKAQLSAVPR